MYDRAMFDLDAFVADCREAVLTDSTHKSAHEIMKRAFTTPEAVMAAVGKPEAGGITVLHRADDLTIINVVWGPGAAIRPHNHNTWALIGIYTGQEDNTFWRRKGDTIEVAAEKTMVTGDVSPLGPDIIHSVKNPLKVPTGAIHVYGADFFEIDRSEWDADTLIERPYDMAATLATFSK